MSKKYHKLDKVMSEPIRIAHQEKNRDAQNSLIYCTIGGETVTFCTKS